MYRASRPHLPSITISGLATILPVLDVLKAVLFLEFPWKYSRSVFPSAVLSCLFLRFLGSGAKGYFRGGEPGSVCNMRHDGGQEGAILLRDLFIFLESEYDPAGHHSPPALAS